jgi:hypothetical protein
MRHRLTLLVAVLVGALALVGSAAAFDCIRVSSSLKGLEASTRSGNWLLLDLSSAESIQRTFANIGEELGDDEAGCLAVEYAASGQPLYFAIGIRVAGPNGILAHRNETAAMADGKGIDQLEQSGIFPALLAAAISCGIPVD